MLTIDGRDGGGQVLRTTLSLAVLTETPVRIEGIRATRPNPGLNAQHLAAVETLADLCDATVEDAAIDAESLTFDPGDDWATDLTADIGTAGSITLLFDAVLPVAAATDTPITVAATGGTDVKWAPTIAYQRHVKLPLLADAGLEAGIDLDRTGFYPAGGGDATLTVTPWTPTHLDLETRGDLDRVEIYSKAADTLADSEVAQRQATQAADALADADIPASIAAVDAVPTHSPGSAVLVRAVYDDTIAGFDALGERGVPAEAVATDAVDRFLAFHEGAATVDRFMADQVMIALALGGGTVQVPAVTDHVHTNREVLAAFGSDLSLDAHADGTATLTATPLR